MDFSRIKEPFRDRFPSRVISIDSHTAGEPTRLVVGGLGPIPGATMKDKRIYIMNNLDEVRLRLTREPRGHRGIFGAIVTDPVTDGADFGLVFMDPRRYPFLCGHGTMGAVATLIETGVLKAKEPETVVVVDTPSGPMEAVARVKEGLVESVGINMVPSFVYGENETLRVPGLGEVLVDTVCVGGFFVMVSSDQIKLEPDQANSAELIRLGMLFIEAANQQLKVRHPTRPEVTTVDVTEFYDPSEHSKKRGRNVVVYGEAHMDRSPCGTGTAAKMTLLHHHGLLGINQTFTNRSPLGTVFEGRIVKETRIGEIDGVVAEVRGSAYITGLHEFVLDPRDPFPGGFLL
jgi:proline racemase